VWPTPPDPRHRWNAPLQTHRGPREPARTPASELTATARSPQTCRHGLPHEAISVQTRLLRPAQPHPSPSRIPARWIQADIPRFVSEPLPASLLSVTESGQQKGAGR
jgi:hypothetical protein